MQGLSHPRKRFGQNFLIDPWIIQALCEAIQIQSQDSLVEIGPGRGALTQVLLPRVKQLTAIEIDRDLIQHLKKKADLQASHFHLLQGDALQFDFHSLATQGSYRLVGNLPYNISTPLLFHLFHYLTDLQDMHFMLQKEVVLRLIAPIGSHHYGRLSVMTQFYCKNQMLLDIPPHAFYPAPRVDSSFVRLTPHKTRPSVDVVRLQRIVFQAFNQRRKRIANSLKGLLSENDLIALNIDPDLRPQALSVDNYVAMAQLKVE